MNSSVYIIIYILRSNTFTLRNDDLYSIYTFQIKPILINQTNCKNLYNERLTIKMPWKL